MGIEFETQAGRPVSVGVTYTDRNGNSDGITDPCGMYHGFIEDPRPKDDPLNKQAYVVRLIPEGAPYDAVVAKAESILGPKTDTDEGAAWYVQTKSGCSSLVLVRQGDVVSKIGGGPSRKECPG